MLSISHFIGQIALPRESRNVQSLRPCYFLKETQEQVTHLFAKEQPKENFIAVTDNVENVL